MKKFKVVLVGCGDIAPAHTHTLCAMEEIEIVGVCDVNIKRAETLSDGKFACFSDYDEMLLKCKPDVVHVCTPHRFHVEQTIKALQSGADVFCEKPFALTLEEANMVMRAEKAAQKQVGVCLQNRTNAGTLAAQEWLQSGVMGKVLGGRANVYWSKPPEYYASAPWRGSFYLAGGGTLANQTIHTLDLFQMLLGGLPNRIQARTANRFHDYIEVEDTVEGGLYYDDGKMAWFYFTNNNADNEMIEIRLVCENGVIMMRNDNATATLKDGSVLNTPFKEKNVTWQGRSYWGTGHDSAIRGFYEAIQNQVKVPISTEDALDVHRMMYAVYRSNRTGQAETV